MEFHLSSINIENINISIKQNWNGNDYIELKNLYLAEDYNKFKVLNKVIQCISGMSKPEFINFFDGLPYYIIDHLTGELSAHVKSLNGKHGDIYGISGIIINNETKWPIEENNYIVDLGDYLSANTRLVYTYNNISGAISGISTINNTPPDYFGYIDLGSFYQFDTNVVETINGVSGDISGILGFIIDDQTLRYTENNRGNINLDSNIDAFMEKTYKFVPKSGAVFYKSNIGSGPTTTTPITDTEIANLGYLKSKFTQNNYLCVLTINSREDNCCSISSNKLIIDMKNHPTNKQFIQFLNFQQLNSNKIQQLNLNNYNISLQSDLTSAYPNKLIIEGIEASSIINSNTYLINLLVKVEKKTQN